MAWPQSQDYNEAIQNARTCFKDPELSKGQAVTNPLGMPLPCSGNFADVYQVHCPQTNTRWAVKCFTRGNPAALAERYAQIDQHLQQAKLPFTVGFRYLDEGIRIRNQWHPVLKMQWVEGFTLNHFIRENLDKPNLLEALLQIWVRMARRLREADMAHADLQHGNVLLVPGNTASSLSVKLIDYDGMWVPALAGQKSGEVGHPAYQHTKRLYEGTYSKEVDRFPLLVVATALRCLRVVGRPLWEKFDNGDNLLFREADLAAPERSPLFAELEKLEDAQAQLLVEAVRQGCSQPLEQAPFLDTLLPEALPAKKPALASPPSTLQKTKPAAKVDIQTQPEPIGTFAYLGEATPDAEPSPRPRRKRDKEPTVAPAWKKWAIIGGSGGAALLVLVLVLALSGGQKDQKEKPDDRQASNRDDSKKNTDDGPRKTDKQEKKDNKDTTNPGDKKDSKDRDNKDTPDLKEKKDNKDGKDKPVDPPIRQIALKVPVALKIIAGDSAPAFIGLEGGKGADTEMQMRGLPPRIRAVSTGINPETGMHEWILTARKDVTPGDYEVTVWARVNKEQIEETLRLTVAPGAEAVRPAIGKEGRQLAAVPYPVFHVAFSPDGRKAVASGYSNLATWDLETGKLSQDWQSGVCGTILPDGRHGVCLPGTGKIVIWDAELKRRDEIGSICDSGGGGSSAQVAVARGGKWAVSTAADIFFDEMGKQVFKDGVTLYKDVTVKVWDLEQRKEVRRLPDPPTAVTRLAVSSNGKRAVVFFYVNRKQALIVWDLETGREVRRQPFEGAVLAVDLSEDGRLVAIADSNRVRVLEVATGREVGNLGPIPGLLRCVTFSADGQHVLAGGRVQVDGNPSVEVGEARLWEVSSGRELLRLKGHTKEITDVAISPDGRLALTGSLDPSVRLWDLKLDSVKAAPPSPGATGKAKLVHQIEGDGPFFGASFCPDGSKVIAYTEKFQYIVNAKTGIKVGTRGTSIVGGMTRAEPVGNDRILLADKIEVAVREVESNGSVHTFKIANPQPTALAVSADGRRAAVVFRDTTVRILDLESGKTPYHLNGVMPNSRQMAFSQDASKLFIASPQPHFRRLVLNTQTRKEICELRGTYSEPDLRSVACTPDGKMGAMGFAGGKVLLWDLENNKEASQGDKKLAGHTSPVHSCAYSADGRFVLTGAGALPNKDCTARLWETATGREVLRLEGHKAPVTVVALSRDGKQAITVSEKTIRIWDLVTAGASD